jgi:hypothetical protein
LDTESVDLRLRPAAGSADLHSACGGEVCKGRLHETQR